MVGLFYLFALLLLSTLYLPNLIIPIFIINRAVFYTYKQLLKYLKNYFAYKIQIISVIYLNSLKSIEKSRKNIWKFQIFAVTLHPVSRLNDCETERKGSKKVFLKKVSKKFGSFRKTLYLCTTFASEKWQGSEARKILGKSPVYYRNRSLRILSS